MLLIVITSSLIYFILVHKSSSTKESEGSYNAFNLKSTSINWLDEITGTWTFEHFTDLDSGTRACILNIKNSINDGYNTINKFIDVYTPSCNENSEEARQNYKNFISQACLNFPIDSNLKDMSHTVQLLFLKSIVNFENTCYKNIVTISYIKQITDEYNLYW